MQSQVDYLESDKRQSATNIGSF